MARDPVCGAEVDALRARAIAIVGDETFYFCSPEHKAAFLSDGVKPVEDAPALEDEHEDAPAHEVEVAPPRRRRGVLVGMVVAVVAALVAGAMLLRG